jgi:hypothetical protein
MRAASDWRSVRYLRAQARAKAARRSKLDASTVAAVVVEAWGVGYASGVAKASQGCEVCLRPLDGCGCA